MTHKVFVYGTLKSTEPNHHWLTKPEHGVGKFVGEAVSKTKFPLVIATKYNVPFLLHRPGEGKNVKGEVYEVDDVMLGKLDLLEQHPSVYTREIDDFYVTTPGSTEAKEMKCWIYYIKKFNPNLLTQTTYESYCSSGSHGLTFMGGYDTFEVDDFREALLGVDFTYHTID